MTPSLGYTIIVLNSKNVNLKSKDTRPIKAPLVIVCVKRMLLLSLVLLVENTYKLRFYVKKTHTSIPEPNPGVRTPRLNVDWPAARAHDMSRPT